MSSSPSRRAARRNTLRAVAAAVACAVAPVAFAQGTFPSQPIRLVVPVAAGGGIDTAFRAIAPAWGEALGQPVVIENKPGAGQVVGSDFVAKAKPDGYTLLAPGVPIAFNTALGRKLPYDAIKDFTPISHVVSQPLLVVVHPGLPVNSMATLIAYAKAQPASAPLQYTTGGIGSYGHLWWEMVRSRQGVGGQHVPYNGIAPALKDVMGGQVPLLIDAIVPTGAQVKAGTVRGIAIVASKRAKSLPDLPTLVGAGFHRPRRRAVLRHPRPGRHGSRRRAEALVDPAEDARDAGRARQAAGTRLRRRREFAGRVREADPRRDRTLDPRGAANIKWIKVD